MQINKKIYYPDGSVGTGVAEVPDDIFSYVEPYVPTTEDRLSALEAAMLTMMEVQSNV